MFNTQITLFSSHKVVMHFLRLKKNLGGKEELLKCGSFLLSKVHVIGDIRGTSGMFSKLME